MAYNAAKAASNKKSDAKYMQILIKPYKNQGTAIRAAAEAAGQPLQRYILEAVAERMHREGTSLPEPNDD
jgi:uncharacterized protein (DUF1778 family)